MPTKLQRQLDLIAYLLGRRFPVPVEELMERIPAYAEKWVDGTETDRAPARRLLSPLPPPDRRGGGQAGATYPGHERTVGLTRSVAGEVEIGEAHAHAALEALRRVGELPAFPLAKEARSAFRKLAFDLDPAAFPPAPVLFVERPGAAELADRVRTLSDALLARKRVRFRYHGIHRDEVTERDVAPYGLLFQRGHWYLIGHDAARNAIRIFRAARMDDVEVNKKSPNTPDYEIPADFRLDAHANREAWELGGEEEEPVRALVRFRFPASLLVERNGQGELVETEPDGAADRLARILYIIPAAARDGGARIADLARALGVSEREVLHDIQELTARSDYLTAGPLDHLQIDFDDQRVHIWTTGELRRPARLSPREALSLGIGLRMLAAESEPARRAELLDLAGHLERALAAPIAEALRAREAGRHPESRRPRFPDSAYDVDRFDEVTALDDVATADHPRPERAPAPPTEPPSELDRLLAALLDDDEVDVLAIVFEAARTRRECRIRYLKPGAPAPEERRIHPYHLVHAEGPWYLLAHCVERGGVRIFRLDRILDASVGSADFAIPDDFDPARHIADGGKLFHATDDVEVAVRYSPRIARWILERVASEAQPDGSVVVRHRVADTRWAIRHVLQYGADAEILEPTELRTLVAQAASRVGWG